MSLSYPEQVDFTVNKTLIMGVTRLNSSKKGKIFPDLIRERILLEIPKVDRMKLELGIMNCIYFIPRNGQGSSRPDG